MTVDISMTIFSLVLMGGNYFFPWTGIHEVLGAALFVLWGVHVALNRRGYASLAKGTHACKPLVFFVYVAAHRTARRHDQPKDSGKIEADSSRKSSGRGTKSRRSAVCTV